MSTKDAVLIVGSNKVTSALATVGKGKQKKGRAFRARSLGPTDSEPEMHSSSLVELAIRL